ncbi:MAG: hemolysin III family protein [Halanaerobiales bacterium]|jgi:hemolysin III|nr:hemolysin III family protein [Defluviitaleaceae bacterium]
MFKFKDIIVRKHFSLGEEIAHSISHGAGLLLGIAALVLLVIKGALRGNPLYIISMLIYSVSLIFLYTNSMFYHAFPEGKAKNIFERLDHSSIYILIAGTYTPFYFFAIGGIIGIVICCIQWLLAILGVIFKVLWIEKYTKIHVLIFLIMGWMIIFFAATIYKTVSLGGFVLLLSGGLCYSIGVLFFVFDWFKYHHFVWHLFVLAGSILLFFTIYFFI